MTWRPYREYKEPGIEWLGQIPRHWGTERLKRCARLINDKVADGDADLTYTGLEHIESWTGKRIVAAEEAGDERQAHQFSDGDVLFGKLRPYLAKVLRAKYPGMCSGELLVLRPVKAIQDFLFYYMVAPDFVSVVDSSTYGVKMPRASWEFIGILPIVLPTRDEQHMIAGFLDRETDWIDALIEKKKRQIELLQEKRTALISHAVTKGLDPNVKMKDPGIEWLGPIPTHWEINRLRYLVKHGVANGIFKRKEFFGTGVRLINVFDIYQRDFLIDIHNLERVEVNSVEQRNYAVRPGDIFFVRSSLKIEGVGRSACMLDVGEPAVFECHIVRVRPIQARISSKFLVSYLNSVYAINRLVSLANVVTMATIDQDKVKSLEIALPPRSEQDQIMGILDRETAVIDDLERKIQQAIGTLREYRSALISAAVTGKIDVREEVA